LAAAPAGASAASFSLNIDDHEDLLEQLIELDADDIAEMRDDFAEARADIAEAIRDIEDAKDDVKGVPFGGMIARIAFRAASATVSETTETALDEVRSEMAKAERELDNRRADLGEAEYEETRGAFAMLHEELAALQAAIDALADALRQA
ncbi:MAG: hypothetical protein ACX939_10400, partial [Hyphococcus sp.]